VLSKRKTIAFSVLLKSTEIPLK